MNRAIKFFAAALAILSLIVLAACGGNKFADKYDASEADGGGSSVRKKVTLRLGLWPEDTDTRNVMLFQQYKQAIESQYEWITIEPAHYVYSVESFIPLAESGTAPNLFDTWFTEPKKLISNGYVADITDKLKEKGWFDDIAPAVRELMSDDEGRVYGVPRDCYALGTFMNLNLLRKAGYVAEDGMPRYPATLDDFAQMAGDIKAKTGKAGFIMLTQGAEGGWQFSNIVWNFGGKLEELVDGKWTARINSPEAIAAMGWVSDLKWKYDALPDDVLISWAQGLQLLGTGNGAMLFSGQDAVDRPTKDYGLAVEDFSIAPIPAGPGGQYALWGGVPYMFSAKTTPDQAEAGLLFLESMGRGPVISEEALDGLKYDAQYRALVGIPILPAIPAWTNASYINAFEEVRKVHENVDFRLFEDFYAMTANNLHAEEPYMAQELYSEISPVIQEVLMKKDADITALMEQANANFQTKLDREINRK